MRFHCFFCNREYSHRQGRHRHVKKAHPFELAVEGYEKWNKKFSCMEVECNQQSFNTVAELRDHLTKLHSFQFVEECEIFSSEDEFQKWKTAFQKDTNSSYIQHGGVHVRANADGVRYYYCSRSGSYESKSLGIRSSITKKLGFFCTATMLAVNQLDGTISVSYCNQHYKHQCLPYRQSKRERLVKELKDEIRKKISK